MYQEAKQTCVLNMHFEDLYAVPRQVLNLVRLKELRIVGNPKLEMIPPALSKLVHLRVLKLCANALGALFEDWSPFTQLQIVDLSSNKLRWIPDSLVQLEHLEELHMSGNALEYLPEDLSMMKSLRILRMQSNALQYLPESIGCLSALEELALTKNKLCQLPSGISHCSRLRRLLLSHNNLSNLPESMSEIGLVELHVSHNALMELPCAFYVGHIATTLATLNLQANGIVERLHGFDDRPARRGSN